MIASKANQQIIAVWNEYTSLIETHTVPAEQRIDYIDTLRQNAIPDIQNIFSDFLQGKTDIGVFKTALDGYNKRNNHWGFTAIKGQMFFNQLVKNSEHNLDALTLLLKDIITEPSNLSEALVKIEKLEIFTAEIFSKTKDKRKAPKPKSVAYFLSYFWQIYNPEKWPIYYTSLITVFSKFEIWTEFPTQRDNYEAFFKLNDEIKQILTPHPNVPLTNWNVEHAFWYHNQKLENIPEIIAPSETPNATVENVSIKSNFNIYEYIVPKVAKLTDLGNQKDNPGKGVEYEKLVAEIFRLLDFEVESLGQGSGRNPDAILRLREDNIAFIVDAKAYTNGYSLGTDDRAIKEYIAYHCPKLIKDGYKKIGFIIVSNSFNSDFSDFINDITWNTDIKRFMLITSEALLYLLAYKTKDKLNLSQIIESLIRFGNLISIKEIIDEFEDV